MQVLLVVGARVEVHGQQVLRRHTGASGVELQLADRDACAVCPEVAQAKDSAAIRDADEPDVLLRPVLQNLLHLAAACDREIHAARLPVNVAELQARFADGRVVHDRQKARRVRHDGLVEEGFVVIEQIDEIDIAFEVRRLLTQLHHHALQLQLLGLRTSGTRPTRPSACFSASVKAVDLLSDGSCSNSIPCLLVPAMLTTFLSLSCFVSSGTRLRCPSARNIGMGHLRWIDNAIELLFGDEAKLQRGRLQRKVVVHRVVRDL